MKRMLRWHDPHLPAIKILSQLLSFNQVATGELIHPYEAVSLKAINVLFFASRKRHDLSSPVLDDDLVVRLRAWVRDTRDVLGESLLCELVDPQSLDALWKAAEVGIELSALQSDHHEDQNPGIRAALASLESTAVPGTLEGEEFYKFDAFIIRRVFELMKQPTSVSITTLRDVDEFRPFISTGSYLSTVEWELFDLATVGLPKMNDEENDPLWAELKSWEPQSWPWGLGPKNWKELHEYFRSTNIDTQPFDEPMWDLTFIRNSRLHRQREVPVLVMAFYLRRIHSDLAAFVSHRVEEALNQIDQHRRTGLSQDQRLEIDVFSGIIPYCLAMEMLVECDRRIFPEKPRRGRKSIMPGLRDWFLNQMYELTTHEVVRAFGIPPSGLFPVRPAYPFQETTMDRYTVAACIASIASRRNLDF